MHMTERIYGFFKLFLRICWIVPKKYLLLLDQTILIHFRSSINRPLNLPQFPRSNFQYPERKYIINENYFGWSGVYFIFMLYNYYVPTYHRFLTATIASQTSKRHLSACNIWTFSRRFSRNLTPRAPKNSSCVLFILIIW